MLPRPTHYRTRLASLTMDELRLLPPDPNDPALPVVKERKITAREAEESAEIAGLTVVRVRKLEASSKIGKFIEQLGAQRIGRTTLVLAQEEIENGIKQCDDLLAKSEPGDGMLELCIEVLKIRQAFTDQLIKVGASQMKNEERFLTGPTSQKSLAIPFPPGSRLAIEAGSPPEKSG